MDAAIREIKNLEVRFMSGRADGSMWSFAKENAMNEKTNPRRDTKAEAIKTIATKMLGLETLETRNSDALDFHDVAVWKIAEALNAAYEAGQRSAKR